MRTIITQSRPYLVSVLLGAIGGGIVVMIATKAIPTMLANMMSAMMGKMMSQMEASGCNPQEM